MLKQYQGWANSMSGHSGSVYIRFIIPVLEFLTRYKITMNVVSNFRLLLGLIAFFLYLSFYRYSWAVNLLFVTLLLDLLGLALSKYQKTVSDQNIFLRAFVNYIQYVFLLVLVSVVAGSIREVGYNLFIIPVLYLLSAVKKHELHPSSWISNVYLGATYLTHIVGLTFFAHQYFGLRLVWLDRAINFSSIIATLLSVYYFLYIQLRWKKIKI